MLVKGATGNIQACFITIPTPKWNNQDTCINYTRHIWSSFPTIPGSSLLYTETEMSSFWWNYHHWLHWKLSKWQLPVQPVMKISSKWRHFRFSVTWINFKAIITHQVTCGMKLRIHSQSSTVQPLNLGNEKVIPIHALLGMWLLIHAGIKVIIRVCKSPPPPEYFKFQRHMSEEKWDISVFLCFLKEIHKIIFCFSSLNSCRYEWPSIHIQSSEMTSPS